MIFNLITRWTFKIWLHYQGKIQNVRQSRGRGVVQNNLSSFSHTHKDIFQECFKTLRSCTKSCKAADHGAKLLFKGEGVG